MAESHHQNIIYSSPYWLSSQLYFRTHWRHSISKITSGRVNLQNESMWETGPINHLAIMSGLAITNFFQSQNLEGILMKKDKGRQENSNWEKRIMKPLTNVLNPLQSFYPWAQQLVDSGGKRLLEQSIKSLKPLKY